MSVSGVPRALAAAVLLLLHPGTSRAFDTETWSYAQPGNALVMPFDATEGSVSYLAATNIGSEQVTAHWVFWSESCEHLVDVWICLTPNDTVIVDPTSISAMGPDNARLGPLANLAGERGTVVATAYETGSSCRAAAEGGSPTDDALVGSYTIANVATSAAFGNNAITLGLDPTGSFTELPDEELAPYVDVATFDPTSIEESVVILMALQERVGGDGLVEVGPLRNVSGDAIFYDTLEIPTSLPSVSLSCTLFTSVSSSSSRFQGPPETRRFSIA